VAKTRTVWRCQVCGSSSPRWIGRCNECGEFGTYVEEIERSAEGSAVRASRAQGVALSEVHASAAPRVSCGIAELDRVLGGGLVEGSVVLLGGEPGIGKSTLLLQAADALATTGASVLYVCGEESPQQVAMRANRLGAQSPSVTLLPELDVAGVEEAVRAGIPDILVVDSIQTAYDAELSGAPGSVGQVRACTARLTRLAKELGVTTLIVGHVTKEGAIAGPRVLEHMVDTVLYFEGDRDHAFRIVRAVKNRFGSVSEIGIFEMGEAGLTAVGSPSSMLLADRTDSVSGSVVMPTMEGTRPLLVEIQALVTPSFLPSPRRLATGVDTARLLQVLAVLERRAGLSFSGQDVYVSVAGGIRVTEPAVDLPLALALASALRDVAVPSDLAAFGEVSLTGHVRPVAHAAARCREAVQLGFSRVAARLSGRDKISSLVEVSGLADALTLLR
jgi:DNA repair protein RadA/Sms